MDRPKPVRRSRPPSATHYSMNFGRADERLVEGCGTTELAGSPHMFSRMALALGSHNSPKLAAWKQVCEAATPGLRTVALRHNKKAQVLIGMVSLKKNMSREDATFIATFSPPVVLRLLEVVARQRAALKAIDHERST